jgi:hypothetical protein
MSTPTQQRAAERHQAKLDEIAEQIKNGDLIVRQMTPAERKRWGVDERRAEKRPAGKGSKRARAARKR